MSHQASSAGLSYLGTHHFPDWFDNNVSVKGLLFFFCWVLFVSLFILDEHLSHSSPNRSSNFLVVEIMQTSSMHVM